MVFDEAVSLCRVLVLVLVLVEEGEVVAVLAMVLLLLAARHVVCRWSCRLPIEPASSDCLWRYI